MHLFCKQEIPTPGSSPPAVILADRDCDSTSPSPSFSPISDFEQVLLSDRSRASQAAIPVMILKNHLRLVMTYHTDSLFPS